MSKIQLKYGYASRKRLVLAFSTNKSNLNSASTRLLMRRWLLILLNKLKKFDDSLQINFINSQLKLKELLMGFENKFKTKTKKSFDKKKAF